MKRFIVALCILMASAAVCRAQDRITLTDGQEIEAKVLEVTPELIKYKKVSNPNGPVYTVYTIDVARILYQNGETELFNAKDGPAAPVVPVEPPTEEEIARDGEAEVHDAPQEPDPTEETGELYRYQRNTDHEVRYRDIRGQYDTRFYTYEEGDYFSPALSGVASFVLPGLGQCFDGEWGRGLAIVAGNLAFATVELAGAGVAWYASSDYYYSMVGYKTASRTFAVSLGTALITGMVHFAFNIWNICDAVEIAKVKNLYCRDMASRSYALDMRLEPRFGITAAAGGAMQPTAGVSLCFNF